MDPLTYRLARIEAKLDQLMELIRNAKKEQTLGQQPLQGELPETPSDPSQEARNSDPGRASDRPGGESLDTTVNALDAVRSRSRGPSGKK